MTKKSTYRAKSFQLGHIRPVKHLLLGKVRKKLFRGNRKSFCQLYDILQSYIPFASFYPADVVAMQSRTFGQFLLRVAAFIAQAVADSTLYRRPVPPQLPHRQTLSRNQCISAMVQPLQLPVLAYVQAGAGAKRDSTQRRERHADCLLQTAPRPRQEE